MQHATVHPSLIKLGFILRQANIIQPSWEKSRIQVNTKHEEEWKNQQNIGNKIYVLDWQLVLTGHPVEVQLSLIILLLWAEGLQSQLQLLLVQWVFNAQLLNIRRKSCLNTTSLKVLHRKFNSKNALPVSPFLWTDSILLLHLTRSRSTCEACRSVCPEEIQTRAMFTYRPRPCSWSQSHTWSFDQRAKGASTSLANGSENRTTLRDNS